MSSLHEWLQVVHVLAAIVWMGGSATLLLLGSRAMRGDIKGKAGLPGAPRWPARCTPFPARSS